MLDPNVLNYFLIVLGGFGLVWGFRHFSGSKEKRITDFEYAAFSTIWGILVFGLFISVIQKSPRFPELLSQIQGYPALATPSLFIIGVSVGSAAGSIFKIIAKKYPHWRWLKKIRQFIFWWE